MGLLTSHHMNTGCYQLPDPAAPRCTQRYQGIMSSVGTMVPIPRKGAGPTAGDPVPGRRRESEKKKKEIFVSIKCL